MDSLGAPHDDEGLVADAAPIVGARTAAQLRTAMGSLDLVLPAEIVNALDDVSA